MRIRSVRGSHNNRSPGHQPNEIQTLGQMRLALEWRDRWRYEKLKNQNATVDPVWKDEDKEKDKEREREKRKRFAEGMARAEFGRAYWDERRQRDVQLPPGRKGKTKGSPSDR
jgi:hypothetical protein